MDFSRFGQLWAWYTDDGAFEVNPHDPDSRNRGAVEHGTALVVAVTAIVFLAAIAAAIFSSELLALSAVFGSAFLLGPIAVDQTRRKNRTFDELREAIKDRESERNELERERKELAIRSEELQVRAEKVEKQYQTLRGMVNERSPGQTPSGGPDSRERDKLEPALEAALVDLRDREAAEQKLKNRVKELETARGRAEQELARLMATSHTRHMTEREVAEAEASIQKSQRQAREILAEAEAEAQARAKEILAQAEENAQQQASELVAQAEEDALGQAREFVEQTEAEARAHANDLVAQAEDEAGQIAARARAELESIQSQVKLHELAEQGDTGRLMREARIQARELVKRAEEEAERLIAQGKVEFESILLEIQAQERVEKDLYQRIQVLEARQLEAERAARPNGSSNSPMRPEPEFASAAIREHPGPARAIRSSFGGFLRRRSRVRS